MQQWNIKKPKIAEINIVPYVDVMLVLLIIFMVTAPLITQGVAVELPKAHAMALEDAKDLPIVLSVDEHANLFLNITDDFNKPIQPDIIQAEVAAAILKNPQRKVVVRGDKRVNYDIMVQAMVLLQHAGVPSVALETTS